jgi:hypothetical protein
MQANAKQSRALTRKPLFSSRLEKRVADAGRQFKCQSER